MRPTKVPSDSFPSAATERSLVPGVSRNVLLLGLVSLFTDLSSEMVYPLIPIFLTSALAAPASVVGLVEGAAEATASLLRVLFGFLSDRIGRRKPFVYVGYGLSACSKPLLALALGWPVVLFARVADRFGKGVRTPARDALIAESSLPEVRGRAFGFHRSVDTLGAVFGPLIAFGVLGALGDDLRMVFVLAFVPGLISLSLIAVTRETGDGRARTRPTLTPTLSHGERGDEDSLSPWDRVGVRAAHFPRSFWAFVGVSLLFALGNSSDAFLVLRSSNLGLSTQEVVLAYTLFNVVYAALSMPAGILSDRLGRRDLIAVGMVMFAAVYFGFGLAPSARYIWVLFAVYGLYMALTEGVGKALISDLAPPEARATALGLYYSCLGGMVLAASILAGQLWDRVSPSAPFLLGGATASLSALMLILLLPRRPHVRA